MPKKSRGPHLFLKTEADRAPIWYIRDGKRKRSTGFGKGNAGPARQALGAYIAENSKPDFGDGHPSRVKVATVIDLYAQDVAANVARPAEARSRLGRVLGHFGEKTVDKIDPSECKAYARARNAPAAARRELADLQSALSYAYKARKLLFPVPVMLPKAGAPRERWLTRHEAARFLLGAMGYRLFECSDVKTRKKRWAIWERTADRNPHVARFVLLGLGTGTRHDAILSLGFHPHVGGGYVDLDAGLLYRRAAGAAQTNKRKPPAPLPGRLAAHLRRWAAMPASGLYIVSYDGSRLAKMKRAWHTARKLAGLSKDVTPHVLRHTCVTWMMLRGVPFGEAARYTGMTEAVLEKTYGHHHVDFLRRAARALS